MMGENSGRKKKLTRKNKIFNVQQIKSNQTRENVYRYLNKKERDSY